MRAFEPSRVKHHRVTAIAERTNLSTTPPGIKGVVAPLDLGDRSHSVLL
jgi:hypothetical protein